MLPRVLTAARAARMAALAGLGLAVARCGGVGDPSPAAVAREAIIGGAAVVDPRSPVVLLRQPQGICTGVLIAPNLVATVRHCTAQVVEGAFTCMPAGGLVYTGSGAGTIGADFAADRITFLTSTTVSKLATDDLLTAAPDSVGAQILSTGAATACSDDLAFVVLASPILGVTPAPVRVTDTTRAGDPVSASGYGLTSQPAAVPILRARSDVSVIAVGPTTPTALTQEAPLRAVRIGPGTVTCSGDSGDPITSNATGAVIALASLGPLAGADLSCPVTVDSTTTGPLLSNYAALVLSAFAAADASPNLEIAEDAGLASPDAGAPDGRADGGEAVGGLSCAASPGPAGRGGVWALALAWMAVAVRRRRR